MPLILIVALLFMHGAEGVDGWSRLAGCGFVWMVLPTELSSFLLEAFRTCRSLLLATSARLMGAAILPTVAGQLIEFEGIDTLHIACSTAVILSLAMISTTLCLKPKLYATP